VSTPGGLAPNQKEVAKRQQEKRQSEYPGNSYYLIAHDAAAPYRFQRGEAHRRNTGVQFQASTWRVSLGLKVYKEFVKLGWRVKA
jgi:hypothetical protein